MSFKNWGIEPDEDLKKTIEVYDDLPTVRAAAPEPRSAPRQAAPALALQAEPAPVFHARPDPVEELVREFLAELETKAAGEAPVPAPETTNREFFLELLVLSLANLYAKTPIATQLFERAILKVVVGHLPDTDAGRITTRAEDWIRLEEIVRSAEGQKSYSLTRFAFAILSTPTRGGEIGQLMERALAAYVQAPPSPALRRLTRRLGAHFITQLGAR